MYSSLLLLLLLDQQAPAVQLLQLAVQFNLSSTSTV
jgi:hypothetical protein